ncbi:MAG: cell division/cell wall cluster transcriptional repressor MraZ [Parcubacteria group bacterium]|nr:cell division/cell wall cluster transcriptional repressor MraZ [Parcubacteria group bacterium]
MFIGEYTHNLDSKGRLAVPAKFREKLSSGAIITRGLDNCLFVFGGKEWDALAQKLIALPLSQADYLRKYASLNKETVIAGLYNRMEIWDRNNWERYKQKTESASEEIVEKLGELGI